MTRAEIITIGTELLLGDVVDTNTSYLARQLRELGIDLLRTTTIGDNPGRIAEQVRNSLQSCDIVITTGGLGPTIDDPTREAIGLAFDQPLEFHPELWDSINSRFVSRGLKATQNNQRQAFLPKNAIAIENPVGTAPSFYVSTTDKLVICLPGVPDEMKTIFHQSVIPLLSSNFQLIEIIQTRILHVCCMGESAVDNLIADLEKLANPTVGLCAHPGLVDIRIAAKSDSRVHALEMIDSIEREIRRRLPEVIYGVDSIDLVDALYLSLKKQFRPLTIHFYGFPRDSLESKLTVLKDSTKITFEDLPIISAEEISRHADTPTFLVQYNQETSPNALDLYQKTKDNCIHTQRLFMGPLTQASNWAENTALGQIWKVISQEELEHK